MRFLVVGYGSIAKRHIQNIQTILPAAKIVVWRHAPASSDEALLASGIERVVYSLEDALKAAPQAALVTNPSNLHIDTAISLAREGIHLFIEKPFSNSMENVQTLLDICASKRVKCVIAYQFRFYEPLIAMKRAIEDGLIGRILSARAEVGQYLPDWRPASDYRSTVSARSELGGGAVLELSHEIDYMSWLVGDVHSVLAVAKHVSDLEIDVEDVAEMILEFKSGAIGSIHVDFLQHSPYRMLKIIGSKGALTWDGLQHAVSFFSAETRQWTPFYSGSAEIFKQSYIRELQFFVNCINEDKMPAEDGVKTLKVVLAAKESSAKEQKILV